LFVLGFLARLAGDVLFEEEAADAFQVDFWLCALAVALQLRGAYS
jgi:hypothetical protein